MISSNQQHHSDRPPSVRGGQADGLEATVIQPTSYTVLGKWIRSSAIGFALILVSTTQAWERGDVLEAIHQVENPNNTMRIGRRGELGPFQFRPVVWRMYTQKPFSLAADQAEAQTVAELHFDWIRRGLERNKIEVTPYFIGLAWNAGLHATLNGRASATSQYYAQRVANLVEHATKPAVVEPTATVEKIEVAPQTPTAAAL
jgi:hypothetical protein